MITGWLQVITGWSQGDYRMITGWLQGDYRSITEKLQGDFRVISDYSVVTKGCGRSKYYWAAGDSQMVLKKGGEEGEGEEEEEYEWHRILDLACRAALGSKVKSPPKTPHTKSLTLPYHYKWKFDLGHFLCNKSHLLCGDLLTLIWTGYSGKVSLPTWAPFWAKVSLETLFKNLISPRWRKQSTWNFYWRLFINTHALSVNFFYCEIHRCTEL